jgi:hypothetical protein
VCSSDLISLFFGATIAITIYTNINKTLLGIISGDIFVGYFAASEKDRIEQQVGRLKVIQTTLAQRMIPKIRSIEQKRLASYRTRKK